MKQAVRTIILALIRILGYVSALRATHKAEQTKAPRILIIRPDHLGDLVLTTPVLQALRGHAPQAHITMMVGPWSRAVVERHPALDRIMLCPFPGFQRAAQKALAPYTLLLHTARLLRRDQYDLAINLRPDFWWGAALIYLAAIPRRVGYAIEPGTPFLTHTLPFQEPEHATVSNLRLTNTALLALNFSPLAEPYTPEHYPLHFEPAAEDHTWITTRLQNAGITEETPVVVIHPGTGAAVKLWRVEAWANCANMLSTDMISTPPPRIVLTGSPSERALLEEIVQRMTETSTINSHPSPQGPDFIPPDLSSLHSSPPPQGPDFIPPDLSIISPLMISDMTVGQLATVLARAQLVLGVDSGPLHLAVAQDTPSIQIFGPTDNRIFGPWGPAQRHLIVTSHQKCPGCPVIPCGRLDFHAEELEEHPCVRMVSEKRVEEAIKDVMKIHLTSL